MEHSKGNKNVYYEHTKMVTIKCFITLAPIVDLVKKFYFKFTRTFCKLDHFRVLGKIVFNTETLYLAKQ